jgi:hypothetical protein
VREAWAREQLEARLARWPSVALTDRIACATAVTAGFLALVRQGETLTLIGARRHRGRWRLTTAPDRLRHLAACAEGAARPLDDWRVREARRVLTRWCARRAARALVGEGLGDADATRAARGAMDALLSRTALGGRSALAASGGEALAIVARAQGVGAGRALRQLPTGERYLAELTRLARAIAGKQSMGAALDPSPPRLVALLLLEPDELITAGRPLRPRCGAPATAQALARSAGGPESAATH